MSNAPRDDDVTLIGEGMRGRLARSLVRIPGVGMAAFDGETEGIRVYASAPDDAAWERLCALVRAVDGADCVTLYREER